MIKMMRCWIEGCDACLGSFLAPFKAFPLKMYPIWVDVCGASVGLIFYYIKLHKKIEIIFFIF